MLSGLLLDSAIQAAKGFGHESVEPRHVLYAAVRHFKTRPEVEALMGRARSALDPRGSALSPPKVTAEAEELAGRLGAAADPVGIVLEAFKGTGRASSPGMPAVSNDAPKARPSQALPALDPPAAKPGETTAHVLSELNQLVGLASVKRQLASIAAVVLANQERSRAGLAPVTPSLHLVFTGPPGTGKTTVARLVARLYAAAGALPGATFNEVSRADLIAGYVGQTAMKTAEVIAKSRPGVLFIDEAYALTPSHGSDFGAEAIATLVKSMEDLRNELAVIAAGYGEEMAEFVGSNPGLKSRFKTFIEFPDYTPADLTKIFEGFANQVAIVLDNGVLPAAELIFKRAVGKRDFGNARFARSLFEQAYGRMAARAAADGVVTIEEVSRITVDDLQWEEMGPGGDDRRIGFTAG
jgi:hypothetical protein